MEMGKRKLREQMREDLDSFLRNKKYFSIANFVAAIHSGQEIQYKTSDSINLTQFILNSPNCQ